MMQAPSSQAAKPPVTKPPLFTETVDLMGLPVASCTRAELLDRIFTALDAGHGGWLLTANLDFLRRFARAPEIRALYAAADIRVADGMPLVWASRLQGRPLPERIAGSSLVWDLGERSAAEGRRLFLLGGSPGAAEAAADVLQQSWPGLKRPGTAAPMLDEHPTPAQVDEIVRMLVDAAPDVLLVALGSPKQERLIEALRRRLPRTWMVGVGISFSFVAGQIPRAPLWMQRAGLEWTHRLAQEPRRLARRYLIDDAPFAVRLFGSALRRRLRGTP